MKIKVLIILLFCSVWSWGQSIFTNPITGTNPNTANPYTTGQTVNANITVSGIGRGSGITGNLGNDRYNATAWNTGGIDLNDYFEFTLTPNATFEIDFVSFVYTGQASGTGPTNFAFRSSVDGYVANVGTPNVGGTTISLAGAAYQNRTTATTFRFYASGGTGGTFSINDFTFNGTVTPTAASPEINITQSTTILTGGTHNFGNVNLASNSDVVFTIENTGTTPLNLTSLPITTTGDYSIIAQPSASIIAGGFTNFTVRFTPTATGTRTGSISIGNNDTSGGENPYVINFTGNGTCVPFTFSGFTPSSGPTNTEVTITASAGDLTGCTVNFNGIPATVVSATATQIVVSVPTGATTGVINITKTSTGCVYSTSAFTIINQDITSCEGSFATTTDLIIYEVHDEESGSGGTVTLYNGTATTINLSNYRLYRSATYGGTAVLYATLTGTIASGALAVMQVTGGANSCTTPASTNGTISGGFNDNDEISLRNATGSLPAIDEVRTSTAGVGFYMVRNIGAYSNRATFLASDWSTTPLGAGVCDSRLGTGPISGGTSPTISTQPTLALNCSSTTASIAVAGNEGFAGGLGLAYQWFAVAPNTTTWTELTNTGVYSGATSATLNISSLIGLNGYQYYCQVRENSATCYIATVAVKIETGATTQWNGTLPWTNGLPNLTKTVIINGNYNTGTNGSFDACSVTVNATRTLTIAANTFVNIQNQLNNNGTVIVQNNGSLVQINDAAINTGSITVERTATGVVVGQDYVYWSAPVTGQTVNGVFSGSSPRYTWGTTTTNANGGQGTWIPYTGAMSAGSGYIVRDNSSANFTGVPHNGVFTPTIARGTDFTTVGTQGIPRTATDDNWNLLGNPYPSALDVVSTGGFLDANTNLVGNVKVWSHLNPADVSTTDPFYQNFVSNYRASDYITFNRTGLASGPGDYKVASGQGFMVLMNPGAAGTSSVTFNNSMRSINHANNQFYRSANNTNATRSRMWIDLISASETNRILVGYVQDAKNGLDRMFDAFTDYKPSQNFYSIIEDVPQVIQGKALPFVDTDLVPVGFKVSATGSYTIAIAAVDGLFANDGQTIYLEDKVLDVVHNLTLAPYTFTASAGVVNNRFIIRYTDRTLNTDDFELVGKNVSIFGTSNGIKINSLLSKVKSYVVYNILGQVLASENGVNSNATEVKSIQKNNQTLVVRATLDNGQIVIIKIIY